VAAGLVNGAAGVDGLYACAPRAGPIDCTGNAEAPVTALARICAASTLAVCALLCPPTGARGGEEPDALDREYKEMVARLEARFSKVPADENAATHYLKAVAALPGAPGNERGPDGEPSALDKFVGYELISLSPDAVTEMPGAADRLRAYAPAVAHLRRGAALGRCAFKLDWRAGAGMLLPHLAQMRNLARRATCYGKLLEHEKKPREAARVYLDVIRMGVHLDQDPMLLHALVGIACAGMVAPSIEGLLARGVDAETARLLLDGLRALPGPAFNAARTAETERVWGGWQARHEASSTADVVRTLEGVEKVGTLFGDGPGKREKWIIPEDPKEVGRLLKEAFAVHDGHMKLLVGAMRRPYHEARPRVGRLAAMQKSYWDGEIKAGHFAAAFVRALTGTVPVFHVRVARCEAHLRGLKILAAAALAKAETGEYPATIRDLAKRFPRGVPRVPFTGGNFSYWLPDGLPAVACKADDPKLEKMRPERYHFGLSYRLTLEKQALAEWRERRARHKKGR